MNRMAMVGLYALVYLVLFAAWLALVWTAKPGAETIISYIQNALVMLTGHALTMLNPSPAPPAGKEPINA